MIKLIIILIGCLIISNFLLFFQKNRRETDQLTGVYWGAFDPPTSAHEAIIAAALSHKSIKNLIIVVNNHSYKNYTNPLETRMQLIKKIADSFEEANIEILCQDDHHPINYFILTKSAPLFLCAIAGYDAYKNWVDRSTEEERNLFKAIAVVPRGDDTPILYDKHAFLLNIDKAYKDISSTKLRKACSLIMDSNTSNACFDRKTSIK